MLVFSHHKKYREWRDLGPNLFLHVFDKTLVPILDYGGEIRGIYDWEELERTHLFACKHILNVNIQQQTILNVNKQQQMQYVQKQDVLLSFQNVM